MKKIAVIIIMIVVLFVLLVACKNNKILVKYADVQISAVTYRGSTTMIIDCDNIGDVGSCKFFIEFTKQNSIIDNETYTEETEEIAISTGDFTYEISKREGYVATTVKVYSWQNDEWVETDVKYFGILS